MLVCGIDTAGAACAVALWRDSQMVCTHAVALSRGHDAQVGLLARQAFDEARVRPADLDRVGVCVGPGSFAGVRVGVAFARGLALATGAQAVGVTRLALWAHAGDRDQGMMLGVYDARRGEVVWQAFVDGVVQDEPARMTAADAGAAMARLVAAGEVGQPVRLVGSGAAMVRPHLPNDASFRLVLDADDGLDMATLCAMTAAVDPNSAPARPFYHRPPDATPARRAGDVAARG